MARKNKKIASSSSKLQFDNLPPEEKERLKDAIIHRSKSMYPKNTEQDNYLSHEREFELEYEIANQILNTRNRVTRTEDHYYIPVLFHVAFPEGEYPTPTVQDEVRADINNIIEKWNSSLRDGNIGPPTNNSVWQNPKDFEKHGVLANCTFFLVDRIPKKDAYPFMPVAKTINEGFDVLDDNSWHSGIEFEEETLESYTSTTTIEEIEALQETINSSTKNTSTLNPQIGDIYEGGILFYIDEEAGTGLVAALEDLGNFEWGCFGTNISGASGQAIGTGYQNTIDIVEDCPDQNSAAYVASNSIIEGYTDWYLPSAVELEEMYNTIGNGGLEGNIGGFENNRYWSSSESSGNYAWYVDFGTGVLTATSKNGVFRIRVIRSVNFSNSTIEELRSLEEDYYFFLGEYPGILFYEEKSNLTRPNSSSLDWFNDVQLYKIRVLQGYTGSVTAEPHHVFQWGRTSGGGNTPVSSQTSSMPVLSIQTNYKVKDFSGIIGAASMNSMVTSNINKSMFEIISPNLGADSDYIIQPILHEFLHTVGAAHGQDSVQIKGLLTYGINATERTNAFLKQHRDAPILDKLQYPFTPPFQWGPNPEDNFETIDPDEKIFIEYIYNRLIPELTDNFQFTHKVSPNSFGNNQNIITSNSLRFLYSIPSFWGGSYITEESSETSSEIPGVNKLVINPVGEYTTVIQEPQIGDSLEGGILFYKSPDGSYALIVATEDLPDTAFGCSGTDVGTGTSIGDGENNTVLMRNLGCTSSNGSVALESADWESGGYTDWYIPSINELSETYITVGRGVTGDNLNIANFGTGEYLSSSERNINSVWTFQAYSGGIDYTPKSTKKKVRLIRKIVIGPEHSIEIQVGTRKGPNVTMYNPICTPDENGDYTIFDPWFWLSYNWFNPDFPAFPDNTKVEDMFSEAICPCLYVEQSIEVDNETKYYTVMNSDGSFTNDVNFRNLKNNIPSFTSVYQNATLGAGEINIHEIFGQERYEGSYYGNVIYEPTWLKTVGEGDDSITFTIFPVYTGFTGAAQIPAKFKIDINKLQNTDVDYIFGMMQDSTLRQHGYDFNTIIAKYLRLGNTNPNSPDYNPFKINDSTFGQEYFSFFAGNTETNDAIIDFFKGQGYNGSFTDIGDTIYGPLDQNTIAAVMYYTKPLVEALIPNKDMVERLNAVLTLDNCLLRKATQYGSKIYNPILSHSSRTLQDLYNHGIEFMSNYDVSSYVSIEGCTDPDAFNYNPDATVSAGIYACIEKVFGCTDVNASNFNEDANVDDGSCFYYSLDPIPLYAKHVCNDTTTPVCNLYDNSGDITPNGEVAQIAIPGQSYYIYQNANYEISSSSLFNAYGYNGQSNWTTAALNYIRPYQYSCDENPLASETEGPENLSGGCVNVEDNSLCVYPSVTLFNCTVLEAGDGLHLLEEYMEDDDYTLECIEGDVSSRRNTATSSVNSFIIGSILLDNVLYTSLGISYKGRFIGDSNGKLYEFTADLKINRNNPLYFRNQLDIPINDKIEKDAKNLMKIKDSLDKIINFTN